MHVLSLLQTKSNPDLSLFIKSRMGLWFKFLLSRRPMQKIVDDLMDAIPGVIAIAVSEIDSGMALASKSKLLSFEPEIAAAYNAEVIKQKLKAKRALGLEKMDLEDILITMTDQYHVLTIVPGNKFFVYTIASKDSNLAIIRNALRKRLADIANNIA